MRKMKARFGMAMGLMVLALAVSAYAPQPARADINPRMVDILVTSNNVQVLLYARLVDCFRTEMESAILAGVPAIFTIVLNVYQERSYWDRNVFSKEIYRTVKYDNLKKTFTVTTNGQGPPVVFYDFESAQKAMEELSGISVIPLSYLQRGFNYSVHVKVKMDKVNLPFSMEYVFFFVSLWNFETPLYKIRFSY